MMGNKVLKGTWRKGFRGQDKKRWKGLIQVEKITGCSWPSHARSHEVDKGISVLHILLSFLVAMNKKSLNAARWSKDRWTILCCNPLTLHPLFSCHDSKCQLTDRHWTSDIVKNCPLFALELVHEGPFSSPMYVMYPCQENPLQIQLLVTETSGDLQENKIFLA